MYGQTRAPKQPCIENVGNTWRKKHFSAARSLERGSLSRLPCCHSSRMRMSAAAMIRPLHLFYRMRTFHHSRTPSSFPVLPISLITPFWFVPRDKAGTCPRPLCCSLSRGRSAAREREPLVQRRDRQQSRALYRRALIKFNAVERN